MRRVIAILAWAACAALVLCHRPGQAEDGTDRIAEDLRSNDLGTRKAGYEAAGDLATPQALDLVAQAFARDPEDEGVIKGAWAIARIRERRDEEGEPDAKWKSAWKKVADLLQQSMLKHREKPDVVLGIIRAMAQMGDPVFVKPLSDDLWKVKDRKVIQGRILGLSCIRDKSSVDAIMDLLYVTTREGLEPYGPALIAALRRLTGQTFQDRISAKKWWKDNREKFEFDTVDPKRKALEKKMFDKAWQDATEGGGGR